MVSSIKSLAKGSLSLCEKVRIDCCGGFGCGVVVRAVVWRAGSAAKFDWESSLHHCTVNSVRGCKQENSKKHLDCRKRMNESHGPGRDDDRSCLVGSARTRINVKFVAYISEDNALLMLWLIVRQPPRELLLYELLFRNGLRSSASVVVRILGRIVSVP